VTAQSRAQDAPHRWTPKYRDYVALGDSWSADVVIADTDGAPDTSYVPVGCFQRHRDYPKLVAAALKVGRFADATCGSATTVDLTQPQSGLVGGGANRPQFDRLTSRTDLVTIGIGGNDAKYASSALSCLNVLPFNNATLGGLPPLPVSLPLFSSQPPIGGCKERFVRNGRDQLAALVAQAEPKVVRALRQIHRRSPLARVLLVNYLDGVPSRGCWPILPVSDEDVVYLHGVFRKLNDMLRRAAKRGGARLVDTYAASHGHDACSSPSTRYVEGLGLLSVNGGPAIAVPAHPNQAGADAQARYVLAAVRKPPTVLTPLKCHAARRALAHAGTVAKRKRAKQRVATACRKA
jgi:lysophospholipase L1-like esterase